MDQPTVDRTIECTGDVVSGDTIEWTEAVFTSARKAKWLGDRTVVARVLRDSYGADKQQHTFTIEVLSSEGFRPLEPGTRTTRKGRVIYRNGTTRLPWQDESARKRALDEKHSRGDLARAVRDRRRELEAEEW